MGDKKRAILLARISNDDPDTERLEDQIAECRRWAEEHGYTVVGRPVQENGVSGKLAPADRPALNEALEKLRAGQVDVLVYRDDDRLGRDWWTTPLLFECDSYADGIQFAHQRRPDDPESLILDRGIRMTMATAERVRVTRRTARGRGRILGDERFSGGSYPWWLTWVQDGRKRSDGHWELNQEALPTVRAIIEGYQQGRGAHALADALRAAGAPLPSEVNPNWQNRSGRGWRPDVVMGTVRNPALAGRLYHRPPEVLVDKMARATARRKLIWQIIDCPTVEEADALAREGGLVPVPLPREATVIDWPTFAAIQEVRRRNRRAPKRTVRWLLQGRLRCGSCGRLFGLEDNGPRRANKFFRCGGRLKRVALDGPRCTAPRIAYDPLVADLETALSGVVGDPEALRTAVADFLSGLDADVAQAEAAVGPVDAKLAALADRRQRLIAAFADGLAEPEYRRRLEALDKERSELERRAATDQDELLRLRALQDLAADIRDSLARLDDPDEAGGLGRLALGTDLGQWIERLDIRLKIFGDRIEVTGAAQVPALPIPRTKGSRSVVASRWR